ncbi:MAG: acetate/propionate family kinase [Eubacteriaceae bacterium]
MKLLIINCGSSSIKLQLVNMPKFKEVVIVNIERLGKEDAIVNMNINGIKTKEVMSISNHSEGLKYVLNKLFKGKDKVCKVTEVQGVGHRIVHGGEKLSKSMLIDDHVINYLTDISDLAPLHNPAHISGISACKKLLPKIPQVAAFDNGYHAQLPKHVYMYAIPNSYYNKYNIRKFGFHGIAFRSMTHRVESLLDIKSSNKKMILLMLGSGTTANAVKYGKSIEVSTGFTPLEGLVQSTRCGDIDPAALTYIMKKDNISPEVIEDIINKESGWYGMSNVSNDLREIYESANNGDELAQVTIDAICHRIKKYIGAYAAILGGVDILAFGGGVGENAWYIREKVCSELNFLGIELNRGKNKNVEGEAIISTDESKVKIAVVKVNEEKIIADDTYEIIK